MKSVAIGVYLDSEPERLAATLAQLRAATAEAVEIMLLPDGPGAATRQMLETVRGLRQLPTDRPLGAAAAFNRLLRHSDADLMIFLEAGALVGPGWLGRLLAALRADARNGLAGPSTNRSWNMQAAFPGVREAEIGRTAALAAARFGDSWRTMEPLYCLADFCYAVRREVAEAVGGADEGYGAGPCWEMDYSARAARAGFRAVWAQSAFVYRRPFTLRRQEAEAHLFEASRRRYQDKFCGLRLSGARTGYAKHCRGDACPHFAPTGGIQLRLPLGPPSPPAAAALVAGKAGAAAVAEPAALLVSCIMPTRNRRDWMLRAIAYFLRQDYPERELIIIDDSDVDHGGDLPSDPRIRYVHSTKRLSIGAKRNHAAAIAQGGVIVHWDDDDWYAADRLNEQVAPLLSGTADVTALSQPRIFDLDRWEFWTCTAELHHRLFVRDVHGGTLAYRRHVFEKLARYPDSSLAEDAVYLNAAVARGARLQAIPAGDLFFYVRHGGNAWAFTCGQYLDGRGWRRVEEPDALAPDREFYAARSGAAAARRPPGAAGGRAAVPTATAIAIATAAAAPTPLVSCIMPTYNRRPFVAKAIEYFLRQDYPNRELIILDDGDDRVADLVPDLPSLHYVALPERLRLGAKRNAAIAAGRGEIIVHWDDDDWMDPGRISSQVAALQSADADICGASRVWFCEIASGRLSLYQYPSTQRRWLYGASLCYRRSLWRQKPFEPLDIGEDTRFVWASPSGRMVDLDGSRLIVAMVHAGNTSRPQPLRGPNWVAQAGSTAANLLGEDWLFYAALSRQQAGRERARTNP